MSLVGSLEDLGLADILQIVSLARKSGRLMLRSGGDAGRIILREGLVCGAAVKGEQEDLRALLVAGGFVSADAYAQAAEQADRSGRALAETIAESGVLPAERLDALRRGHVERAVMRMFLWRRGEFSFEVRDDVDPEDVDLLLPSGINTQYLAMEATRLRDEGGLASDGRLAAEAVDADEMVFSGESDADAAAPLSTADAAPASAADPQDATGPVDAMALATAQRIDVDEEGLAGAGAAIPVQSPASTPAAVPVSVAPDARAGAAPAAKRPVIAMDPDLTRLEWLKAVVGPHFARVHIFQRLDPAVERIRQYLRRGVVPIVLAQPSLIERNGDDALTRLRGLASDLSLFALVPDGRAKVAPRGYDAVLPCPVGLAPDPELWSAHERLAVGLCAALRGVAPETRNERPPRNDGAAVPLGRLKQVSAAIRDPARQGDVLGLVLSFAAEQFSRVVVFMVRDDVAVGMAQRGLDLRGGPDDHALRSLELAVQDLPALFRDALARRRGLVGPLGVGGSALAGRLGPIAVAEAYVAPIESGGCVAALLYADNAPESRPVPDTTALEIVLHEAGLALDRALLERALANVSGRE